MSLVINDDVTCYEDSGGELCRAYLSGHGVCSNGHILPQIGPMNEALNVYRFEYRSSDRSGIIELAFERSILDLNLAVLRVIGDDIVHVVCDEDTAAQVESRLNAAYDLLVRIDVELTKEW